MITVETPLHSIEREMDLLKESSSIGPNSRLFAAGAMQALRWIKDGAIPPHSLFEAVCAEARRGLH